MSVIIDVFGREVLDSRGNPTVEVEVVLEDGSFGPCSCPFGRFDGAFEAVELRDCDKGRYLGKGTLDAVAHVNEEIADALIGLEADDQRAVDDIMLALDGTDNKGGARRERHLGRLAGMREGVGRIRRASSVQIRGRCECAPAAHAYDEHPERRRACRQQRGLPGVHDHAGGCPHVRRGAALVRRDLPHVEEGAARRRASAAAVGDEGGFAPNFTTNEEPLEYIVKACEAAGYAPGSDIMFAMDPASTEFYDAEKQKYVAGRGGVASSRAPRWWIIGRRLSASTPIISIEDGMAEEDWGTAGRRSPSASATRVQLVGDDLFVTNSQRLAKGIEMGCANAILIR